MAAALKIDQGSNSYVRTYDVQSSMFSQPDRQIRFQIDRIQKTVAVAIYRILEDTKDPLVNNLDSSRVTVSQKQTGDSREPVFKPTTLDRMDFESVEALLGSLKPRQIYPILFSPDGTVNSFTINV